MIIIKFPWNDDFGTVLYVILCRNSMLEPQYLHFIALYVNFGKCHSNKWTLCGRYARGFAFSCVFRFHAFYVRVNSSDFSLRGFTKRSWTMFLEKRHGHVVPLNCRGWISTGSFSSRAARAAFSRPVLSGSRGFRMKRDVTPCEGRELPRHFRENLHGNFRNIVLE